MGLPPVVVFRAEVGPDFPFWTEDGVGLGIGMFRGVPRDLADELSTWCRELWELEDDSPKAEAWDAEGRRLFEDVARYLPPGVELRWDNDP